MDEPAALLFVNFFFDFILHHTLLTIWFLGECMCRRS